MVPPSPQAPGRLEIKLEKWRLFTLSIVIVLVVVDLISAFIGPSGESNLYYATFGSGGLFTASIGLTVAAAGDMLYDHRPASPPLGHIKWLYACIMLTFVAIALYVLAKENLDLSSVMDADLGQLRNVNVQSTEIQRTLEGVKDTKVWVSLASPTYCVVAAAVSFQTVKRSEP